jgi:hypothetical protein
MQTRHIKPRKWLLGFVCLWLAGSWVAASEPSAGVGEYQVKAAYLYNLTKFTDWPASAFASNTAPMVIGVVGEDPFGKTMDDAFRGEIVRDHPLVVKRLRRDEDLRSCHVLFISYSEKERLPELLEKLKGSPVLTVSDAGDFVERGGMVNFFLVQKTVKMEINQAAVEEASLQISAKLLKLARIAKPN